ncbi:sulfatase-like hydrolase/transferase [Haloarcula hispanica]|uniref:Sulfatase n=1 Tax=Haloarcula hispanica TaxID=51589 RepID=A0A482T2T3_HALHI|nr:sulfatase-like hydrolase/transferase [Haloarcula hispanica]MCJ0618517.1 sulfatase-like hydrolase/transferase [Haloarcula hispanica]RYJ09110.1 sulfatase [Haloarcula hispanica]
MRDIIFVTADSVRYDFVDAMEFVSTFSQYQGVTGAHYTRPSLASILTASYQGAIESRAMSPTVAEAFSQAGYTTIGLSSSPHTDPRFGFDAGFDVYNNYCKAGNRGNPLRQFASQFDLIRKVYHRFRPPHAKLSNRLPDDELIDNAIAAFNDESGPRFMWLHMMGTHRPYGLGDDAVPKDIDRKALFAPEKLSVDEKETITQKYRQTLSRADAEIERLVDSVDSSDPLVVFSSDHGDEFGEDGHYFHQPQRRRVVDTLTTVPVATNDLSLCEPLSVLDIAPSLLAEVGGEIPTEWHGKDVRESPRDQTLTIAPWHGTTTVAWQDFETKIVSRDADVSMVRNGETVDVERDDVDDDLKQQMRDLGYVE